MAASNSAIVQISLQVHIWGSTLVARLSTYRKASGAVIAQSIPKIDLTPKTATFVELCNLHPTTRRKHNRAEQVGGKRAKQAGILTGRGKGAQWWRGSCRSAPTPSSLPATLSCSRCTGGRWKPPTPQDPALSPLAHCTRTRRSVQEWRIAPARSPPQTATLPPHQPTTRVSSKSRRRKPSACLLPTWEYPIQSPFFVSLLARSKTGRICAKSSIPVLGVSVCSGSIHIPD